MAVKGTSVVHLGSPAFNRWVPRASPRHGEHPGGITRILHRWGEKRGAEHLNGPFTRAPSRMTLACMARLRGYRALCRVDFTMFRAIVLVCTAYLFCTATTASAFCCSLANQLMSGLVSLSVDQSLELAIVNASKEQCSFQVDVHGRLWICLPWLSVVPGTSVATAGY